MSDGSEVRGADALDEGLGPVLEALPVSLFAYDAETLHVLEANAEACRRYGYTRDEFVALTIADLRDPEDVPAMLEAVRAPHGIGHRSGMWRHRRKDGSMMDVDVVSSPVTFRGRDARLVVAIDVTERLRAELELRKAERLYRSLVEALPAITYVELPSADPRKSNFVYLSPQVESLLGYTAAEIMARPDGYLRLVHPGDLERVVAENAQVEATGERFDLVYRLIARDGRTVWLHSYASPVPDEQGEPRFWHGVALDVTEQHEAAEALRQAEERYRLVVENATDLITLFELDGTIVFASPSHERVLGLQSEDLVGHNVIEVLGPLNADTVRSALAVLAAGERSSPVRVPMTHRDGWPVVLETSGGQPIFDEHGRVQLILGVTRDVTARVRAEREREELLSLLVSAQEEERARIAADIHDDPIQAMVAVGMQLDLLAEHTSDPDLQARVERLRVSVRHAIDRLRRLLFDLSPPSLESGLGAAVVELTARPEDHPGFELRIDDRAKTELPIETRTVAFRIVQEALANVRKHAKANRVVVRLEERDGGMAVTVEDDGIGIASGTTSAPGHLGLRGMQERATLMGGWLEFGPRPGGGTYVELWLPGSSRR